MLENGGCNKPQRSNPLLQTKRSRLQQKRCSLNEQITKELRLKAGAENLFRATEDPRLKQQVSLELSFLDSNIQLLRDQLANLNTAVQVYQNERSLNFLPLIPLGLKETKQVDFTMPFKDFILEHYSEDGFLYESAIRKFSELRAGATVRPSRDQVGVDGVLRYYDQLDFVDRRFFPPDRHLAIYFEWYDALTGEPSMQRSIAFEKASILFNLAALHTQIGAREERGNLAGLDRAIASFRSAAGILVYLRDHFANAPSMDMNNRTLSALTSLMLAQAQECCLDRSRLILQKQTVQLENSFSLAEEAAFLSAEYDRTHEELKADCFQKAVPSAWVALAEVKRDHYKALAHFWTARGVLAIKDTSAPVRRLFRGHFAERKELGAVFWDPREPPENSRERAELAGRHLKFAALLHEDAKMRSELSHDLQMLQPLQKALTGAQKTANAAVFELGMNQTELDSFCSDEPADIISRCVDEAGLINPEFGCDPNADLFADLGPLSVFNAHRQWSAPRTVRLKRERGSPGFGFSIRGDCPVFIAGIEPGGLAEEAGLCAADVVVSVGDHSVKWASHDSMVSSILAARDDLTLGVVRERQRSPLSSVRSCSTLSSSTSASPPTSLPTKFRPSYFGHGSRFSVNTLNRTTERKKKPAWKLKSLLFTKKLSKSEPNLFAIHDEFFCR